MNAQVRQIDAKRARAYARVERLVTEQDTTYRPIAFAREAIGRDTGEAERYLQRVLDVIAQVAAIFGAATATDERVETLALTTLGGEAGTDRACTTSCAPRAGSRCSSRRSGRRWRVKVGAKLVSSLIAAESANRVDKAARVRAQLLSLIYGRAAADSLADAAHADLEERPLSDVDFAARFEAHLQREAKTAAEH